MLRGILPAHLRLRMPGDTTISIEGPVLQIRSGKTGAEHHDMHALILHFRSQAFKQSVQGMLAGTITRPAQQGCVPGMTGGHDNGALPFHQTADSRLGAVQGAKKVHRHDLLKDGGIRIDKSAALGDPGIVHKDIDSAV